MRQNLSLAFIKDLIDFNLLNKNFVTKNNQIFNSTLTVLHLNKEFKVFVNIIRHVVTKKYNYIFIFIEDPFMYQLLLKQVLLLNQTAKIPVVVSLKRRSFDKMYSKNILTISISNTFKNTTEEFIVNINTQNNQNTGGYKISSEIKTIKSLIFFIIFISNLLKIK